MIKRRLEIIVGVLTMILPIAFILYGFFTLNDSKLDQYRVRANFNNVTSLINGTKVEYKGLEIGKVEKMKINSDLFNITVTLKINSKVRIPKDSIFTIVFPVVLGDSYVDVKMGKSKEYLQNNDITNNTKDGVSLEEKIGRMLLNKN